MKKRAGIMLSAILASTMVLTPVYATESIDLDSMSVEDLVSLQKKISEKLEEMGEIETAWDIIPRGTYTVGTDIKAGQFEFVAYDADVSISTFNSEETYKKSESLRWEYLGYDDETGDRQSALLNLSDGEILEVSLASAIVKEVTNASWMPD